MKNLLSIAIAALVCSPFTNLSASNYNPTDGNEEPVTLSTSIQNAFAYPAKASEIVALSFVLNTNEASTLVVTDENGTVVARIDEPASIGKHVVIYDVARLSRGVYTCSVACKTAVKTFHFSRK